MTEITLEHIEVAERLFGKEAARKLWNESGLPTLEVDVDCIAESNKDKILSYIANAGENGKTKSELANRFRKITPQERKNILQGLIDENIIIAHQFKSRNNKDITTYFIVDEE